MIHTIFEGTSEIQQLVIARAISGLVSSSSWLRRSGTGANILGDGLHPSPRGQRVLSDLIAEEIR